MRKVVFLLEEFSTPSPSQQLLDRFLMGYPRNGLFHKPAISEISAYLPPTSEAGFGMRAADFGLKIAPIVEQAVDRADAVVIASRRHGAVANDRFAEIAVARAPEGSACFIHGALSSNWERGRALAKLAASRRIALLAGTPLSVTWRLPEVDLPRDTALAEALIVAQTNPLPSQAQNSAQPGPQGTLAGAELNALEGLLPVIERRGGGEAGIRSVRLFEGEDVWRAGDRKLWSWPLLAAAISRSHSPQGDPVLDGRTQDLTGLGLLSKLARRPQAWLLEHRDGLRTSILVLDGVVGDFNFAVRAADGRVFSAQLFRAPPPLEQHFSLLAAAVEDFFQTRKSPWPLERNLLIAGLLEAFRNPATRSGKAVATPELHLSYSVRNA
jgi:hypothetical protein